MADRPEAAIQAILTSILNMQQLNLSLADLLAGTVGEISQSGFEGQPGITASRRSKPRGCYMTLLRDPLVGYGG